MATYTKLKSGEWGIRSISQVRDGQTVTVTTKAGKTKTETVAKVVWSGNGVWLAAIRQSQSRQEPRSSSSSSSMQCNCYQCARGSESLCVRDWGE